MNFPAPPDDMDPILPPEEAYNPPPPPSMPSGGPTQFDAKQMPQAGPQDLKSAVAASPNVDLIMRIPVTVKIVIGSATMPVGQLVKLGRGAVIPLDRRVGEPVDVVVNGQVVAHGEIVVIDENGSRFGVTLTEVIARGSRAPQQQQ